ncbi:hypothetical protein LshimejAT787_0100310 [Lyophyllum shimeji]|uniref:Uncharacterized protein n=1 Tax=Lyophyllum shimeji TaxID=47721 RepID=A0A9P3UJB9_LYOSH|nr:hypothetical protein LshimejAT787_0100310 [Lyophyllum shimeji]
MVLIWTFKHFKTPAGSTCCSILFALIFVSAPLVIPSILSHRCSLRAQLDFVYAWATSRTRFRISQREHDTRYASPAEEERYWARAIQGQIWLSSSNARVKADAKLVTKIPLITSYTPALLPPYRVPRARNTAHDKEYYLSARTFCKWHRMVFPGPVYPTLQQASKLRQNFSNCERREMFRISRMLSDEVVFGRRYQWTPKYRDLWRKWRSERRPDVIVVFA